MQDRQAAVRNTARQRTGKEGACNAMKAVSSICHGQAEMEWKDSCNGRRMAGGEKGNRIDYTSSKMANYFWIIEAKYSLIVEIKCLSLG